MPAHPLGAADVNAGLQTVEVHHHGWRFAIALGVVGMQAMARCPAALPDAAVQGVGERVVVLARAAHAGAAPVAPDRPDARGAAEGAAACGEPVQQQVDTTRRVQFLP